MHRLLAVAGMLSSLVPLLAAQLVTCTLVMLTSDDRIGGVRQAHDVGINRYLL